MEGRKLREMRVKFYLANKETVTTSLSKATYDFIYSHWKAGLDVELGERTIKYDEVSDIQVLDEE